VLDDQRPSVGITADATLASVSTSAGAPDDTTRPPHASEPEMWSDASSPTPGDGFSLSLERGLTGATGFLKLVSFLRRNIAIRS